MSIVKARFTTAVSVATRLKLEDVRSSSRKLEAHLIRSGRTSLPPLSIIKSLLIHPVHRITLYGEHLYSAWYFLMTNTVHIQDDSPFDLGVPTELESYQNQCLMLLDELHEAWANIRRLKGDTRTLVAMNDALRGELDALKADRKKVH